MASDLGFAGRHVELARAFEPAADEVFGRPLPMNIDGAMAAILLELGLDPRLGKAFYVIARAPGLAAHVFEEQTNEPTGTWDGRQVRYEAPSARELPPD